MGCLFHKWNGCKCMKCGQVRVEGHDWEGCVCRICGQGRDTDHAWGTDKCLKCGKYIPADLWADKLTKSGNYKALAAYLCAYHNDEPSSLWNKKKSLAEDILKGAGASAVEAMMEALEEGGNKEKTVAELLAYADDPKAAPLLKKLNDRKVWSASGSSWRITSFLEKYADQAGETEKIPCAVCGQTMPVTDMDYMYDQTGNQLFFCLGTCWSKRGLKVKTGIGRGCPNFHDGVCVIKGRDTGLCSLQAGHYASSCFVYQMNP